MGYNNKFCKHGISKSPFTQQGEIVNDTTMNIGGSNFYDGATAVEGNGQKGKKKKLGERLKTGVKKVIMNIKEKKYKGKEMASNRPVPTKF